jgi:phosphatidylglycerol:prolipoprotein diacylglycerol transferase
MHPILIPFGTFDLPLLGKTSLFLPTYGTLFATGTLLAWWWFLRRARGMGLPAEPVFNLTFYSLLAAIAGAKLTLILVDWRYYLESPREILGTFRSAGVLMGGILAGGLMFVVYARRTGLPVLRLGDAIAAPLALAQSVGRLGCFAAGCCYGVPAHGGPFAVTFTDPDSMVPASLLGVPLVPTQLLQMANDLLLSAVLTLLWRKRAGPDGTVLAIYLILYSVTRGTIEFWRGDAERGIYFGVSTSQIFSIAGIAIGVALLLRLRLREAASTRTA